jgi:hypothetical protein
MAAHRGCLQRLWKERYDSEPRVKELRRHLNRLIRDAKLAGTIRPDVTRADVSAIIWALNGAIENANSNPKQVCSRLITIMFSGLAPAADSAH